MDGKQNSKGKATSTGTKATGKGPQKRYPLRTIISSLMFSNGDSDQPFDICQDFVLDVIRSQLRMLVGKANKLALERGRKTIGYLEMAFAFRRHPTLIKRLVLYIQMTLSATTLIRSLEPVEELSPSEDTDDVAVVEEEFMEEVEEEEGEQQNDSNTAQLPSTSTDQSKKKQKTKSVKLKRSNRLITAIREFDVLGHLLAGFDPATGTFPNWLDPGKLERMQRQVQRTGQMSAEMYARFAVARQMSFCSHRGVKSARLCKQFMKWLRKGTTETTMAMEPGIVFVLNFCASEIVTILVESALLVCSEQEREMSPDSGQPDAIESPLQLCHYQEALRRNQGWARRGDILFGNF